jgi:hypothetical protein
LVVGVSASYTIEGSFSKVAGGPAGALPRRWTMLAWVLLLDFDWGAWGQGTMRGALIGGAIGLCVSVVLILGRVFSGKNRKDRDE